MLEKHKSATRSLKSAKDAFDNANKNATALRVALEGANVEEPKQLSSAADLYTQIGYDIRVVPKQYGVDVKSFRLNSSVPGEMNLAAIGQPFAKAKNLKVISVVADGGFTRYEDFKKFMHWFDAYPVAISSVEVKKDTFTIVLDIYGN